MKVWELKGQLKYADDDAEVFIAEFGSSAVEANKVFFAEEINSDGELAFCDLGMALGGKAVLITYEEKD